ncbi:long-chain fatty acid--CoA ligase [Actinomadura craniellae]|uniref:Long-chain fatty acid--CoA ligase n=1 Tax=Actinomadura craniellae TaxID=2231787 RepID=A0A365HCR7_9ACTN|nr:class I adenylate-forming enzyme family protein [Actinomadura craniellae]RAY16920.1 long-chain fatty acid--CoA ligase [Actinomadura craniellae]
MSADLVRETFRHASSTPFGRSLIAPEGPYAVVVAEVLGERMAVFERRSTSVLDLLTDATRTWPDREYLADDDRRLTYGEHLSAVARLARILRDEYGVAPGDRVALFAANGIDWVIGFWAALAAGAVATAMNSFWSEPELDSALALVRPRAVLGDGRRLDLLARVAPEVPRLEFTPELHARITRTPDELPAVPRPAEDAPALLIFTSGTTGRPKAVAHSHRALLGFVACNRFNALLRAGAPPAAPPPPARVLVSPPLFHLSALYGAVLMFTVSGGLLVMRPGRFDEERTLRALESERVSVWLSVGSAAPRVAAHPARDRYNLSGLASVVVGGAPMSPTVKRLLCAAFPAAAQGFRMGYTSSEGGSIVASIGGADFAAFPESTGPIQDGVQIAVRDRAGNDLPPGAEGLIHVRSPYTMLGYWNDPRATAEVIGPGRWLAMGDVGRVEDGLLYVNSRARDMIFVSAENVHPSEVENRLEAHRDVLECAVAGIDDPVTGQAVRAFVVLREGAAAGERELADWCGAAMPPYKVPTSWRLRTEPLPRNAAGKVLRTALLAAVDS